MACRFLGSGASPQPGQHPFRVGHGPDEPSHPFRLPSLQEWRGDDSSPPRKKRRSRHVDHLQTESASEVFLADAFHVLQRQEAQRSRVGHVEAQVQPWGSRRRERTECAFAVRALFIASTAVRLKPLVTRQSILLSEAESRRTKAMQKDKGSCRQRASPPGRAARRARNRLLATCAGRNRWRTTRRPEWRRAAPRQARPY